MILVKPQTGKGGVHNRVGLRPEKSSRRLFYSKFKEFSETVGESMRPTAAAVVGRQLSHEVEIARHGTNKK